MNLNDSMDTQATSVNTSVLSSSSNNSFDNFDGAFNQLNNTYEVPNPFMSPKQSAMTESNGLDFGNKVNPFAVSNNVMHNKSVEMNGHGKYDAFRSSTLELNQTENGIECGEIKTVDLDLFKDAAAAAFSEFGKSKHEYKSSKLAETNAFKKDDRNSFAVNGKVMNS